MRVSFFKDGFTNYGQFMEQSGKQIPDAWYVKLTFSSVVTFNLTKTENRERSSYTIALSKGTIFNKHCNISQKKKNKKYWVLLLKV